MTSLRNAPEAGILSRHGEATGPLWVDPAETMASAAMNR